MIPDVSVITPISIARPMEGFGNNDPIDTGDEVGKDEDKIKRLKREHALYKVYLPDWRFYLSAYEGGQLFVNSDNIFRHVRENDKDYNDRVVRAHNLNYCAPLVDFFTNFIFSEAIDRNGGSNSAFYLDFVKNVNRKGDTIDNFMREVADDMQIFGMSYILVDTPVVRDENIVITKQDEKDKKFRPYWVLVKPDEVTDWFVDDFGVFQYAKRRQLTSEFTGSDPLMIERYTEFFLDRIVVSTLDVTDNKKPKLIREETFPNKLGTVPLIPVRYKRSKKDDHMGASFLVDFAYNNREIVNQTSLLQEFLYRQAFNILAMENDSPIPQREQEDSVLGTANVVDVPKGAHFPQYISPPVAPAQFISDYISKIKNEMFVRAAQDALTELFNGEKASGFSQAQSFAKTVPFIASRADTLEHAENDAMTLTMKLMGKDWDGKVRYKDRYELTNLTDALVQLQILVRDFALPSPTFVKEELKRMIREFDGKLPIELLNKVEAEIDSMDWKSWLAIQTQALVGTPGGPDGTSPGKQQQPKDQMSIRESASEAKVKTSSTTKLRE